MVEHHAGHGYHWITVHDGDRSYPVLVRGSDGRIAHGRHAGRHITEFKTTPAARAKRRHHRIGRQSVFDSYHADELAAVDQHHRAQQKALRSAITSAGGIAPPRHKTTRQKAGRSRAGQDEYRYLPEWAKGRRQVPVDLMAKRLHEQGLLASDDADDFAEQLKGMEHERSQVSRSAARAARSSGFRSVRQKRATQAAVAAPTVYEGEDYAF